jgi:hypothetical protein
MKSTWEEISGTGGPSKCMQPGHGSSRSGPYIKLQNERVVRTEQLGHLYLLWRCILAYPLEYIVFRNLATWREKRGVWLQQFLSEHEVRSHRSEVRFWRHDTRCFRSDSGDAPWLACGLVAF